MSMHTPICDFVEQYRAQAPLRLHMPGHKGMGPLGVEARDITEVDGADVLYHADGIIRESEENAAALFGTGRTVYSAEGSSLAIRAMLYLALLHGKTQGLAPRVLAARNAHKTFMTAAGWLDLQVDWLYPEESSLLSCKITAAELEEALQQADALPCAVYLTSPDYLGHVADVAALAAVCHRYGVLLLVDNAHGAYLHFLPQPQHPMDLGADLCCDSAHKTLPVLTGGAYLHVAKAAPAMLREQAAHAMSLFASTSPSYLILQSLDAANAYLADGYIARLAAFAEKMAGLKARLAANGWPCVGNEPLKLCLLTKPCDYTGDELAALLETQGLVCEFADPDHLVMMMTPQTGTDGLQRVEAALNAIEKRPAVEVPPCAVPRTKAVFSIRTALLAPSQELPVEDCLGRIMAAPAVTCPPAIPIVVCGERIDEAAMRCFAYYGIPTCRVVCE